MKIKEKSSSDDQYPSVSTLVDYLMQHTRTQEWKKSDLFWAFAELINVLADKGILDLNDIENIFDLYDYGIRELVK